MEKILRLRPVLMQRCLRAFGTGTSKPYRILGIQQIAIGGLNKEPLKNLWSNLLEAELVTTFKSERENVDEDVMRLGKGPFAVEIDLMAPIDPDKKPKVQDPPLNHIGLWVDKLQACVDYLQDSGVRFAPGGIRTGAAGYDIAFIHPRSSSDFPLSGEGVLIELVQAPTIVIESYDKLAKKEEIARKKRMEAEAAAGAGAKAGAGGPATAVGASGGGVEGEK